MAETIFVLAISIIAISWFTDVFEMAASVIKHWIDSKYNKEKR